MISIQPPFIQPLLPYNLITNCGNTCIEKTIGCPDTLACNYIPGVNTPTPCTYPVTYYNCNNECINDTDNDGVCDELEVVGCQDPSMFNYNILATDSGMCEPFIYGCTDPLMYNYDPIVNTDNGSCEPFVYGCIDSTMLNYDPLANTDNESCITIIEGCMDQSAYNYDIIANVHDSTSCLYSANCITGPGNPYWLNDPCYAWVISVDDYCCENEWDTICQATYDYCSGTWSGPLLTRVKGEKRLMMITALLGRPAKENKNELLFYI